MDALKHFETSDASNAGELSAPGEVTVGSPISNDSDADYESAGEANDSDWEPSPSSKKSKNSKRSNAVRSGKGPISPKAGKKEGKGIVQGTRRTQQKASAKKPRISKRPEHREIVRWSNDTDIKLLLAFVYECDAAKASIPWGNIARHISDSTTESGIRQHLVKVRQSRIQQGLTVPGYTPDKGPGSTGVNSASPKEKAQKAKPKTTRGKATPKPKGPGRKKQTLVATNPDSPTTHAHDRTNTNTSQHTEGDASTAGASTMIAHNPHNFLQPSTTPAPHPPFYFNHGLNSMHDPTNGNAVPYSGSYDYNYNNQNQASSSLASPFQQSLGSHHHFVPGVESNRNSSTGFGAPYANNDFYDYSNMSTNASGGQPEVGPYTWSNITGSNTTPLMGGTPFLPTMHFLTSQYQRAGDSHEYFSMGGFNGNADERIDDGF
ncbi:hypothetical protein EV356DRAFT_528946 [Viridothelium virens]|uniref:Myb-like domain-containing protein n=1 Tax=Viridothelium virens TaxID=1048519 RepID=A0A6A6HLQ7_VIRVR|nr:hypothetical protein EV356DRAFT_528946 [Viridothelium virens]